MSGEQDAQVGLQHDPPVRPPGVSDETVVALGQLSEALEVVEEARGLLYAFHRRCGTADIKLKEAVGRLRAAGHDDVADTIEASLVGRDVVKKMWSFEVVEAYDSGYWAVFKEIERDVRTQLQGSDRRHLLESEMKQRELGLDRHVSDPEP